MSGRCARFACLLALALAPCPGAADELPAFERAALVPLPADTCQELRIDRRGEGLLEVRFYTEPLPRPAGPDPKTSGASLLLAAHDGERASLVVYDRNGLYARSAHVGAPIRWSRHASELCVASGSKPSACAPIAGEVLGTMRIAFGAGWESEIVPCAGIATRGRPAARWALGAAVFAALGALTLVSSPRRSDPVALLVLAACFACAMVAAQAPWRLPAPSLLAVAAFASALVVLWALLGKRRSASNRLALGCLGLLVTIALVRAPHPVWAAQVAAPAVPSLWLDPATWHPRAAHQSLEFRGRPLAGVASEGETWLVVGGSVVFGDGVGAEQTFSAVAREQLRAAGDPIEVLNAGAQGWNVQHVDRLLADLGDRLPLDGIVLVSILNNATLPIVAPQAAGCDASLLRAWLCNARRNPALFAWPKALLPKPANPERHRRALRALVERELRLGREIVLLDEVSALERGSGWRIEAERHRAITREIAAEHGLAFHSLDDVIGSLAPEQRYLDGVHPTAALHLLLGRRLAEILRER